MATFRARHGRGYQTPHRCYHFVRRWRRGLESMHWPHVQPQGYVVGKVNPRGRRVSPVARVPRDTQGVLACVLLDLPASRLGETPGS